MKVEPCFTCESFRFIFASGLLGGYLYQMKYSEVAPYYTKPGFLSFLKSQSAELIETTPTKRPMRYFAVPLLTGLSAFSLYNVVTFDEREEDK